MLSCFMVSVSADYGNFSTRLDSNGGVVITRCYTSASGDLLIPTTIYGRSVTAIDPHAFEDCSLLTSVTIPNSVTIIDSYVFSGCSGLVSVSIPNSVISINVCAFSGCSSLTSIEIPDSVTYIGMSAFENCSSLVSIEIPASVRNIGGSVFSGCANLTLINVESGNLHFSSVDGVLFDKNQATLYSYPAKKTEAVYIVPNSVTLINSSAFFGCLNLISVSLPEGLTHINNAAFENCIRLASIIFPNSLTYVGGSAFKNCDSLFSISIPNNVKTIGKSAFCNCDSLTSVIIGNGVTSIGEDIFAYCSELSSINLGSSLTTIGDNAFYHCYSLNSVLIPNSVVSIGDAAFKGCSNLIKVTIGDNVTSIGAEAFLWCNNLQEITLPFIGDSKNDTGYFGYIFGAPNFSKNNDYVPTSLKKVVITKAPTIGSSAFYGCKNLISLTIPKSVTSIGENAFYNCTSLVEIYIDDLGAWCSIDFENSHSNPLRYADHFYLNNEELTNLVIPAGVFSIPNYAFYAYTELTSITFPDSITTIGNYAFYNCTSLQELDFSASLSIIGENAFANSGLKRVYLPSSVVLIKKGAFDSTSLKRVFYGSDENQFADLGIVTNNDPLTGAKWTYNESGLGEHVYSNACDAFCDECTMSRIPADHVYDHVCDTRCNVCNAYRPITHTYDHVCDFDCNICGDIRTVPDHSYDHACDTTCNICGEVRSITHTFSNTCDTSCNICGANRSVLDHVYDNTCDITCNICGATHTITHSFGNYVYNNNATYEADGTKTRTCSVCGHKETITAAGTKLQRKNPFTDVKTGAYYFDSVLWAVEKGITNGTTTTTFSPEESCTRGQIVTFLWRAAGSPEPTSTAMPFTDVKADAYYYKAILWAVEKGITTGTTATTFSPEDFCTRGQIVTFLWRSQGKPAVAYSNPFTDVKGGAYYYDAVLWAVKSGITNGTSANAFSPEDTCTRAQCVTFLYRCYN